MLLLELVPVPLEEELPVLLGLLMLPDVLPVPDVPEVLPDVLLVSGDGVLLELLDDDGVELEGLVLELLLELGVELVEVSVDELDEVAGGVGGVLVVLLLLELAGGGVTVVLVSFFSQAVRPPASAIANALVINILEFMGNSFRYANWT